MEAGDPVIDSWLEDGEAVVVLEFSELVVPLLGAVIPLFLLLSFGDPEGVLDEQTR